MYNQILFSIRDYLTSEKPRIHFSFRMLTLPAYKQGGIDKKINDQRGGALSLNSLYKVDPPKCFMTIPECD